MNPNPPPNPNLEKNQQKLLGQIKHITNYQIKARNVGFSKMKQTDISKELAS